MLTFKITSLQHSIVKHFIKLKENRRYREKCRSVILMEKKVILELADRFSFRSIILPEGAPLPPSLRVEKLFLSSDSILKKIINIQTAFPIAAEIELPKQKFQDLNYLLVLDGIADPGNLGTLLRTAEAMQWDGVFILDGCADPFNEKALRAAKGSTFRLPILQGDKEALIDLCKQKRLQCYVAHPRGESLSTQRISTPFALILGNEGHGPSLSGISIAIPMKDTVESLNVAATGAILMYRLKNG